MIYTTGYHGHTPDDLRRLAENLNATVVDIRLSPYSRIPGYNQKDLIALLRTSYMWIDEFGNLNYNKDGEPIKVKDMTTGTNRLIQRGQRNYILLCGCENPETCHRTVVGNYLRTVSRDGVREVTDDEWGAATKYPAENYALSIQQPWAWLIVNGIKTIENRNWKPFFRGPFYIHAGKKFDRDGYAFVQMNFPEINMPGPNDFELGGLVGKAELVDVVTESDDPWFMGKYGLVLKNAETIPLIPLRGAQGFFKFELPKDV